MVSVYTDKGIQKEIGSLMEQIKNQHKGRKVEYVKWDLWARSKGATRVQIEVTYTLDGKKKTATIAL